MRLINKKKIKQLEKLEEQITPQCGAVRFVDDGIIKYLGKEYTEEEFKIVNKKNNILCINIQFL